LKIIVRCFFRFLLQTICGERPWIKILMTDFCFLFWVSSFASISFFFEVAEVNMLWKNYLTIYFFQFPCICIPLILRLLFSFLTNVWLNCVAFINFFGPTFCLLIITILSIFILWLFFNVIGCQGCTGGMESV
jgi:hypothetical protein